MTSKRRLSKNVARVIRASRHINVVIAQLLLFGIMLFVSSLTTAAAEMRGDQFVTMMDGNALSGTDNAGSPFSLYFLPGGEATYIARGGELVHGRWQLDKDGDVCVKWPRPTEAMRGCFDVTVDGAEVRWRAKRDSESRTSSSEIVKTFLEAGTANRDN
jgi:hypothetical protein